MKEDYLSQIKIKKYNNKLYFCTKDVKNFLIDDMNSIISKVDLFNIDYSILNNDFIDLYTLLLLIAFSNDYRVLKYKFFLIYSSIEKISEINDPDKAIDRGKSLKYLKNSNKYNYRKYNSVYNNNSLKEIIYEEIENSFNYSLIRQIM